MPKPTSQAVSEESVVASVSPQPTPEIPTGDHESPVASSTGKKVRLKCVALKGQKVAVGKEIIQLDDKGIFEVGGEEAERLLRIPGYEKA